MGATVFCLLMLQKYIKSKVSELKKYPSLSGNISGDFSGFNRKKA